MQRLCLLLLSAALWTTAFSQASECRHGGCFTYMVPGRYAHCSILFKSNMIVYGGRGFRSGGSRLITTLGDVWSFSSKRFDWSYLDPTIEPSGTSGPLPRSSHACALVDEDEQTATANMIVFGGMVRNSAGQTRATNELWKLALTDLGATAHNTGKHLTGTWSRLQVIGTAPVARFDHAVTKYKNNLLVYGGCESIRAYGDVWMLERSASRHSYTWRQLHSLVYPIAKPVVPTLSSSPPSSPDADILPPLLVNGTWANSTTLPPAAPPMMPPPPPNPVPPPPTPYWALDDPNPGARCAHSVVATEHGMIIYGGRIPTQKRSNGEPTWQTLADSWHFDVDVAEQYLAAGRGPSSDDGWTQLPIVNQATTDVHRNRSDHSSVLRQGEMLVMGGLYTDLIENTIYIMKDFNTLSLPSNARDPNARIALNTLKWGPEWRFDHSMIVAPDIVHPSGGFGGQKLLQPPLLYGGGGGMDIFNDLWAYDVEGREWYNISGEGYCLQTANGTRCPKRSDSDQRVNVITSLLFGTIGFALYACVIVCVFIRRWAHYARARELANGQRGLPAGVPNRQTLDPRILAELPKMKWKDVLRVGGATGALLKTAPDPIDEEGSVTSEGSSSADGGSSPMKPSKASSSKDDGASSSGASTDEEQGGGISARTKQAWAAAPDASALATAVAASGLDTSRTDDDDDDDNRCIVCAEKYQPDDDLLWLPCHHIFHEDCVKKWLLERSPTCPFCREVVVLPGFGQAAAPASPSRGSSAAAAGGTEMSTLSSYDPSSSGASPQPTSSPLSPGSAAPGSAAPAVTAVPVDEEEAVVAIRASPPPGSPPSAAVQSVVAA